MGCLVSVQRTEGLDLECEDEEQNWLNLRNGDGKYAAEEGRRKRLGSEGAVVDFGVTEAVEAAAMLLCPRLLVDVNEFYIYRFVGR